MDPQDINSLHDFLYALDLAEEIEFYCIKKGTKMYSSISGPVKFHSLNDNEPRICVIEDGKKVSYYSDGKFKPNGSTVLRFEDDPEEKFKKAHIDENGNPINLPTDIADPEVMKFLTTYKFIDETTSSVQPNLDWIQTKDALLRMCRYYNIFSIAEYTEIEAVIPSYYYNLNVNDVENKNSHSSLHKYRKRVDIDYVIIYTLNDTDDYRLRRSNPYVFSVKRHKEYSTRNGDRTPFIFNNKETARIFIKNFQTELNIVIKGWKRMLFSVYKKAD